jgi:hydrogenase maturation protease
MTKRIVIGVGNALRGDDAVGLCVARILAARGVAGVHESSGDPASLMELWNGAELVLLVDAAQSGAPPGEVWWYDASEEALPATRLHCSTHAFGAAEAIELARSLGTLPPRVIVFGIEGKSFEHGAEISPEVVSALEQAADWMEAELNR